MSFVVFILVLYIILSIENDGIFPHHITQEQQSSIATTFLTAFIGVIVPAVGPALKAR